MVCNLLWQGATPVIVGWLRVARGKITSSGIPNRRHYCVIFIPYVIYQCGRGPHNATGRATCGLRATGSRPILWDLHSYLSIYEAIPNCHLLFFFLLRSVYQWKVCIFEFNGLMTPDSVHLTITGPCVLI
jgi:hypothetical protein